MDRGNVWESNMTVNSLLIKDRSGQDAKTSADVAPKRKNYSSIHSQFLAKTSAEISDFFEAENQKFKKK